MKNFLEQNRYENKNYNLQFSITNEEDNSIFDEKDNFLTSSYFFKNDKSKKALYIIDHNGKFKKDCFIINVVDEKEFQEKESPQLINESVKVIKCHSLGDLILKV